MPRCPLCFNLTTQTCFQDKKRSFHLCMVCQLVFADAHSHLPPKHKNNNRASTNKKQKKHSIFITEFIKQLSTELDQPLLGLSYGCQVPKETNDLIEQSGHQIAQFDPICSTNTQALTRHYDFISCYQSLEHFSQPAREWQQFSGLLKPQGWLAISTRLLTNEEAFAKWHHKNNHLHVCFYQNSTFKYLAEHYGFELKFATDELILMQKTSESAITRDLNTS